MYLKGQHITCIARESETDEYPD